MNRRDMIEQILAWEAVIDQAADIAAGLRQKLSDKSREEWTGEPVEWSIPGLASARWHKPTAPMIVDEAEFVRWASEHVPGAVEAMTEVTTLGRIQIKGRIDLSDGTPRWTDGEIVPGVEVRTSEGILHIAPHERAVGIASTIAEGIIESIQELISTPAGSEDGAA